MRHGPGGYGSDHYYGVPFRSADDLARAEGELDEPPEAPTVRAPQPGDGTAFVIQGLARAYCDNLLDMEQANAIEHAAMKLNWQWELNKMSSIYDVFSSPYVSAHDLQGRDGVRVGIVGVEPKKFEDGPKLILTFHNAEKQMVCNKTNAEMIATMHGEDFHQWIGKTITLGVDMVRNPAGKMVPGVRVRYEPSATAASVTNGLGQPAQMPAQQPAPVERPIGGMGAANPETFGQPADALDEAITGRGGDFDDSEIPF